MKKLATLAVLAAVSATSYAQSSVTLFGVADATVQVGRGSETNRTSLGSGGFTRLGGLEVALELVVLLLERSGFFRGHGLLLGG